MKDCTWGRTRLCKHIEQSAACDRSWRLDDSRVVFWKLLAPEEDSRAVTPTVGLLHLADLQRVVREEIVDNEIALLSTLAVQECVVSNESKNTMRWTKTKRKEENV